MLTCPFLLTPLGAASMQCSSRAGKLGAARRQRLADSQVRLRESSATALHDLTAGLCRLAHAPRGRKARRLGVGQRRATRKRPVLKRSDTPARLLSLSTDPCFSPSETNGRKCVRQRERRVEATTEQAARRGKKIGFLISIFRPRADGGCPSHEGARRLRKTLHPQKVRFHGSRQQQRRRPAARGERCVPRIRPHAPGRAGPEDARPESAGLPTDDHTFGDYPSLSLHSVHTPLCSLGYAVRAPSRGRPER